MKKSSNDNAIIEIKKKLGLDLYFENILSQCFGSRENLKGSIFTVSVFSGQGKSCFILGLLQALLNEGLGCDLYAADFLPSVPSMVEKYPKFKTNNTLDPLDSILAKIKSSDSEIIALDGDDFFIPTHYRVDYFSKFLDSLDLHLKAHGKFLIMTRTSRSKPGGQVISTAISSSLAQCLSVVGELGSIKKNNNGELVNYLRITKNRFMPITGQLHEFPIKF